MYASARQEVLRVNINHKAGVTIKLVLIYHSSTTADEDLILYDYIEDILNTPHESIIIGDFNLPAIEWHSLQSPQPGYKLIQFIQNNNLTQHVNEPTRNRNILDLILSTEIELENDVTIREKFGDHNMITFKINTNRITIEHPPDTTTTSGELTLGH
jgi:hypothetical protein